MIGLTNNAPKRENNRNGSDTREIGQVLPVSIGDFIGRYNDNISLFSDALEMNIVSDSSDDDYYSGTLNVEGYFYGMYNETDDALEYVMLYYNSNNIDNDYTKVASVFPAAIMSFSGIEKDKATSTVLTMLDDVANDEKHTSRKQGNGYEIAMQFQNGNLPVLMLYSGDFDNFIMDNQNTDNVSQSPAETPDTQPEQYYPHQIYSNHSISISLESIAYYMPYNSIAGVEITLVIENNSDIPILFNGGDVYYGEWKVSSSLIYQDVAAHSKARDTIRLYESDLKKASLSISDGLFAKYTLVDCEFVRQDTYERSAKFNIEVS